MSARAADAAFAARLVAWFERGSRDLPWRRAAESARASTELARAPLRDPYAVWISEVMLQQTRVETVIPYFERFLTRFPTAAALAAADEGDVLAQWSGLGYYRRARALHVAAREIVERYGGELPAGADALRSLHGVGPYTAGAIASIAFDLPEALVDGNVARVLARVEGIDAPIDASATRKLLWAIARRRVPLTSPGRYNEALMELGATVCVPRAPRCEACPVATLCAARRDGRERELPRVTPKREVPQVNLVAAVFVRGARVLLAKRRGEGLFGGLWEPPTVEAKALGAARPRLLALGLQGEGVAELRASGRVAHVLSHRRLSVLVATASGGKKPRALAASPQDAYEAFAWVDPAAGDLGISSLTRKILAQAGLG